MRSQTGRAPLDLLIFRLDIHDVRHQIHRAPWLRDSSMRNLEYGTAWPFVWVIVKMKKTMVQRPPAGKNICRLRAIQPF